MAADESSAQRANARRPVSRAAAVASWFALFSGVFSISNGCGRRSGEVPPATASSDASARPADAGAQTVRAWDWVGIVGTGQSLSVGAQGTPVAATRQPYGNLKLSLGTLTVPPFDPTSSALSLVPLVEPIRSPAVTYPSAYPQNLDGESPHTAMASQITALFQRASPGSDYVTVHTVVGESGQPMSVIDKTATEVVTGPRSMGRAYAATLFEARAIARLARATGKTYGIGAIVVTHGETDSANASYEAGLYQLWSDYNADLRPLTGQPASIPMLVSQQQGVPANLDGTSASTIAQWRIGLDHPRGIVCSGPKYQYPYAADSLHLTTAGYERLGEKYGEIYFDKIVLGHDWQPLQPTSAERKGLVVTVHFHVPVPPLAWDGTLPQPHAAAASPWATGRGFELRADGAPVAISSVAIAGEAVRITSGTDLTGRSVVVSYAYAADAAPMAGGTWRWGQLRDSDPFVGSTTGSAQPNYCVTFTMPVP